MHASYINKKNTGGIIMSNKNKFFKILKREIEYMSKKKKGTLEVNIHLDGDNDDDIVFKDYYIVKYNDNGDIVITNKLYCFEKGEPVFFSDINGYIIHDWGFPRFQKEMERIINNHKIYFVRITKNNQCRYRYTTY